MQKGLKTDTSLLQYIPELDGLRALAVGAVFLHHISIHWPACLGLFGQLAVFGWVGVDVFFLLSGFLITLILLKTNPSANALKNFYIKRALRIWPLYYALLAVMGGEILVYHKSYPLLLSVGFLQNFLHSWPALGTFNQTWSLCVEEHFYLIWPLAIFVLPRRALPFLLIGIFGGSPLLRWYAIDHGITAKVLYTASQYRVDSIALGSLIAFLAFTGTLNREVMRRIAPIALAGGVLSVIVVLYLHPEDYGQKSSILYTCLATASAGALFMGLSFKDGVVGILLRCRPLRYVGKISYGLYMLHPFIFGYVALKLKGPTGLALALALSFAAAATSWHFLEKPILGWKGVLTREFPKTLNTEQSGENGRAGANHDKSTTVAESTLVTECA